MLASENIDGMRLGWFPQTLANVNSNSPLRDADIGDVKYMLAERLAAEYGVELKDPILLNLIDQAKKRLTKRSILQVESDLSELSRPQGGPWGGPNWL